jgi:hypothetical protein
VRSIDQLILPAPEWQPDVTGAPGDVIVKAYAGDAWPLSELRGGNWNELGREQNLDQVEAPLDIPAETENEIGVLTDAEALPFIRLVWSDLKRINPSAADGMTIARLQFEFGAFAGRYQCSDHPDPDDTRTQALFEIRLLFGDAPRMPSVTE